MALREPRGTTPAGSPPPPAARAPQAPAHRPGWMVLLSSMTLMYGGLLIVSSLTALRNPQEATRMPITRPLTPPEDALAQQLAAVNARVVAAHQVAIRANAAASLALALLMLYAAASTLSRDRHGRTATLAAAWLGIVYQLGSLSVAVPIARDYARNGAALLAQIVTIQTNGQTQGATPEAMAKLLLGAPILMSIVGVLGSLVLIRFFGGRRGRTLYGLEPARGEP